MKKKRAFLICIFLLVVLCSVGLILRYKLLNSEKSSEPEPTQVINKKEVKYINNFQEFESVLAEQSTVMLVFGKTGCQYCQKYIPELEKVLDEQDVDIYYINASQLSEEDLDSVMHSGLTVPGKCNSSGVDRPISKGFGTPLSLIVESRSTVDCIRGYKSAGFVTSVLKNITK